MSDARLASVGSKAAGLPSLTPRNNGRTIRQVCAPLRGDLPYDGLFTEASAAIDGSKFKAVNDRDKNFTRAKPQRHLEHIDESVARYIHQMDCADRQEPSLARTTKTIRLK